VTEFGPRKGQNQKKFLRIVVIDQLYTNTMQFTFIARYSNLVDSNLLSHILWQKEVGNKYLLVSCHHAPLYTASQIQIKNIMSGISDCRLLYIYTYIYIYSEVLFLSELCSVISYTCNIVVLFWVVHYRSRT